METSLMYWAHGIEDTKSLGAVWDNYLFGSSNVQIQHNQQRYLHRFVREPEKGLYGRKNTEDWGLYNNNKNHKYKYH